MTNGFRINKQGIRKMTKEIEREFARNPVRVPLEADRPRGTGSHSTTVNNYNAPGLTPFFRSGGCVSRPVARGCGQGDWSDHVEQQEASHSGAGRP